MHRQPVALVSCAGAVLLIAGGIGACERAVPEASAPAASAPAASAPAASAPEVSAPEAPAPAVRAPRLANASSGIRVRAINRMNQGIRLFEHNDITGAVEALQDAIKIDPSYAAASHTLGQIYRKRDMFDQAETAFKEAITKAADQPNAEYYYDLGATQTQQGNLPDASKAGRESKLRAAVGSLEESLKLDPQQHKALFRIGTLYQELDMDSQAVAAYRKAIAVDPSYSPAFATLGNMYIDNGDSAAGMAVLQEGAKLNKDDPRMFNGLGRASFELHRMQDSIDAFAKARALDPEDLDALYGLGMAHAGLGHPKEASENLSLFLARAGADTRPDLIQAAQEMIKRMASPI